MAWIKQGRIFHLDPYGCRTTHCQVPTPYVMEDRIRVYYACRNTHNQSYAAYFDLSKDLKNVIKIHQTSVMDRARPGMFDSDGIMPSCAIPYENNIRMYYIGWNARTNGARYHNEIGLATSEDGEYFKRNFEGPVIGRSTTEPGLAVMPFVLQDNWYRCWYQSLTSWELIGDKYEPVYVIKYAESLNGIEWHRYSFPCFESKHSLEAFSRPTVIFDDNKYKMWFCYRDSKDYRGGVGSYRIGYAESVNGAEFTRMDEKCGITPGNEGEWDSQMICYPYVIKVDDKLVMFYNGNDFGQSGVGVALWE